MSLPLAVRSAALSWSADTVSHSTLSRLGSGNESCNSTCFAVISGHSRGARLSGLPDSPICYGLPSCSLPCTDKTGSALGTLMHSNLSQEIRQPLFQLLVVGLLR
jgi:hypothetical protein